MLILGLQRNGVAQSCSVYTEVTVVQLNHLHIRREYTL